MKRQAFFIFLFFLLAEVSATTPKNFQKTLLLMGSRFEVHVVSENKETAEQYIQMAIHEIQRIEQLISSWDKKSETTRINQSAGKQPVVVNKELFQLIKRCVNISELTQGAFDITVASLIPIWKFDGSLKQLPAPEEVKKKHLLVDYKKIILNEEQQTVFLTKQDMKIGFGAIGKGYAAQKAKQLLQEKKLKNGLINAGGDLTAWGNQANGKPWTIAISDPENKARTYAWLNVSNTSVVTSGDYEKFSFIDGKRYSHILNPKTGYPSNSPLRSVTIVCSNAELADALATSVFVLGEKLGMTLINKLEGVEGLLITQDKRTLSSKKLKLNYTP